MPVILKNNAFSTLATAITASDTAIVVANGNQFPALSADEYFYATLVSPAGTTEIVKVTARVSNSLTVVRAQDGSSAASFQVGALVEMRANAASIADINDEASEVSIADAGGYYTATDVEGALQEIGGIRNPKDVATLLADTALTYTNAPAGTVVRTRAEGFAYEVAATGALDHHVTTAGGIKLYVMPTGSGYNVRAFGAKGDGATDDGPAFQAAAEAVGSTTVTTSFAPYATSGSKRFSARSVIIPKTDGNNAYRIATPLTKVASFHAPEGCLIDCAGGEFIDISALDFAQAYRCNFDNLSFVNFTYVWKNWSATLNNSIQTYAVFRNCSFAYGLCVFAQNRSPNTYILFEYCITDATALFKGFGDHIRANTIYGAGPEDNVDSFVTLGGTIDGITATRGGNFSATGWMLSPLFENADPPDITDADSIEAWISVYFTSNVYIGEFRLGGESGGGIPLIKWDTSGVSGATGGVCHVGPGQHVSTGINSMLFYTVPSRVQIEDGASLAVSNDSGDSNTIYVDPSILEDVGKLFDAADESITDGDISARRHYRFGRFGGSTAKMLEARYTQSEILETISDEVGKHYTAGASRQGPVTNATRTSENGKFLNLRSLRHEATDDTLSANEARFSTFTPHAGDGWYTVYFAYRTINGAKATLRQENRFASDVLRQQFHDLADTDGAWRIMRVPMYLYAEPTFNQNLLYRWESVANQSQAFEITDFFLQKGHGSVGFPATQVGFQSVAHNQWMGDAAPTFGQWYQGAIVWDRAPAAGGSAGWICTASGSPGTWKTFGAIAA